MKQKKPRRINYVKRINKLVDRLSDTLNASQIHEIKNKVLDEMNNMLYQNQFGVL